MEAFTRWLRALIFTPGDSPATGAQEGNRTPDLGDIQSMRSQLDTLTVLDADAPIFNAFFGVTVIFHVPLATLEKWHCI